MENEYIRHKGVVERIDNQNVFVRIEQKSSCKDCHAASACLSADKKEKTIEVSDSSGRFELHEEVVVSVRQSMGLFATVVAYVIPLLLVITCVVIGLYASGSEVIGGIVGLLVLVPYFLILYLLRDKIKKSFTFTLSKKY